MNQDFDFLEKEMVKRKLIDSSLFLMAYHLLKSSIIDGVREFFICGFDEKGLIISDAYNTRVLTRSKYELDASLIFLMEAGAISQSDIDDIHELRDYRNKLAHDIPTSIYDKSASINSIKIKRAGYLLNKIDNFWGRTDAELDSELDVENIDFDGIKSLRSVIFDHIAEIVREDDISEKT